jgi:hypothetical protein
VRKTKIVTIDWGVPCADPMNPQHGENRDYGKQFLVTEMPAEPAEKWANRLYLSMSRVGLDLPEGVAGWGAILAYGALRGLGNIPWSDAEPLLAEMMTCVRILEPAVPGGRVPTSDDIEEVRTRYLLRSEVVEIHAGFSPAAMLEALAAQVVEGRSSPSTPTSSPLSEPSSPPASPP